MRVSSSPTPWQPELPPRFRFSRPFAPLTPYVGTGSTGARVVWALLGLGVLTVFTVAAFLEPSPDGIGTHTQLGLPPCGFYVVTGFPCPGCGMTTSFAHMIRFGVWGSLQANPCGTLLFLASAVLLLTAVIGFAKRLPVIDVLEYLYLDRVAITLGVLCLAVWGFRVIAGLVGA